MSNEGRGDLAQIDKNIRYLRKTAHTGDYELPSGNPMSESRSALELDKMAEEQKTDSFSSSLTLLAYSPALTVAALCGVLIKKTNLKGGSAALGYLCAAGASYASLQLTERLFNSYRSKQPEPAVPASAFTQPHHQSLS